MSTATPEPQPPDAVRLDATVPAAARRYNYLQGGKDNFEPDRRAAEEIRRAFPAAETAAAENRRFVLRTVRYLAEEHGIRQFLDIGCGIPTGPAVHTIAQHVHPDARVVYADNDPLVATHSRALLVGTPQGRCEFIDGDLRHPRMLLAHPTLRTTFDMHQPIAVLIMAVLHFIPDTDEPHARVRTLLDGLPRGSFLAMSHGTADLLPTDIQTALATVAKDPAQGPLISRSREQIAAFADSMTLLGPGVTPIVHAFPDLDPVPAAAPGQAPVYGLLARTAGSAAF